jgi:hypothetical protein
MAMAFQWVWRVRVLGWRFKFFSRDSLIIKVSQYIKRFMVSLQVWPPGSIFEVLPHDPHVVLGGFERFLGSGRVNWGQIAMFRVSKEW